MILGTSFVSASQDFFYFQNNYLPQFECSFADLDARDSNNQPVRTLEAENSLNDLFRSSLYNLLVRTDIYSVACALSSIARKLNPSGFAFARGLLNLPGAVLSALISNTKQTKKSLALLSGFVAACLLLFSFRVFLSTSILTPKRMAPSILRC